jgi:hypothetical protein
MPANHRIAFPMTQFLPWDFHTVLHAHESGFPVAFRMHAKNCFLTQAIKRAHRLFLRLFLAFVCKAPRAIWIPIACITTSLYEHEKWLVVILNDESTPGSFRSEKHFPI